ncbi:hypothetical protein QL285_008629 [Trifolium repens]|nr:hypothetical protein QL285_008629 [Trifolium repens]
MVGKELGVFLDFDEETARMARFDVARIKVLTTTWASIDTTLKVEVEGVCFNLWLVEERGLQRSTLVVGEEQEEVGSVVVPGGGSGDEDVVSEGGEVNSGEDDISSDELQHGGTNKGNSDVALGVQLPKGGENSLTCNKSTNIPSSQKEIPSVAPEDVGNVELGCSQGEKESSLAVSVKGGERISNGDCGTQEVVETIFLNQSIWFGGPHNHSDPHVEELGRPLPDPFRSDPACLGLVQSDPHCLGQEVEEGVYRYSSMSEPEEVLSSHRSKVPNNLSKTRRQKSCSKVNPLVAPKCLKLVEAMKEGGARARRRRQKGGVSGIGEGAEVEDVASKELNYVEVRAGSEDEDHRSIEEVSRRKESIRTPTSGINHISESDYSRGAVAGTHNSTEDKEKLIAAAKLLSTQKDVGFTFVEPEGETVKQLV